MAHDSPRQHAGGQADLVQLDRDHPGFRDPVYRARRNDIARAALEYRGGQPPVIEYTEAEHAVWRQVLKALGPLHEQWAPRGYVILNRRLGLDRDRIP
jgi:phenylalanine-4-hydroxylase